MDIWAGFVNWIYATLVSLSMAFGGNMGLAIAALSFGVRLALLPLTLWLANRSIRMKIALQKLEPELSRIRKQHKDDPWQTLQETSRLQRQHGISLFDGRSMAAVLVQAPLFLGVFSAVRRGVAGRTRFLWIRDLTQSDPALAVICAILSGLSALWTPGLPESQRSFFAAMPAMLTLLILWKMSSGVLIYSFSSSVAGLVQTFWMRRRLARCNP